MRFFSKSLALVATAILSVLAVAATLLVVAPSSTVALAEGSKSPEYVALGDSITWGYEPGGEQLTDQSFVSILAADKGYTYSNEGVIGNTAAGILRQLESGDLDARVASAKVVTITCGGNDLMQLVYEKTAEVYNDNVKKEKDKITADDVIEILADSTDKRYDSVRLDAYYVVAYTNIDESEEFKSALESFIANLNKVTARIHELNPDARIYVATQYNPYEHFSGLYELVGKYIGNCAEQLRQRVIDNAKTGGYTVADVYGAFKGKTAEYCNAVEDPLQLDFHPSVAGHAAIAAVFSDVVREVATVTPDSLTKTYGDADPKLTADVSGIEDSGSISYMLSRESGEDAGKYEITASGDTRQGEYNVEFGTATLTITAKSIVPDTEATPEDEMTGVSVTALDDVTYDGASHRQAPTITDSKTGKTLVEGTDYELSYEGSTKRVGTVTVTVLGIGNYTGNFELSYRILTAPDDASKGEAGKKAEKSAASATATPATGDASAPWQQAACVVALGAGCVVAGARARSRG